MGITVAFLMVTCIAILSLDFNIFLNEAFELAKKAKSTGSESCKMKSPEREAAEAWRERQRVARRRN